MAWNYRKRVTIAPGVHLNISKKGLSTTVGMRGASITFGKNGTYVNTGIPGTGFYSRQKIGGKLITPMKNTTNSEPKHYSHGEYVMGFCACLIGASSMLIGGVASGGFLWWVGFFIFAIAAIGQYRNMSKTSSRTSPSIADSIYIKAAKEELSKTHNDIEKRILQNFIDCYTIVDEIDEEEGIIESLKQSGKNPELISVHEQKLNEAKTKLADVQYDVDKEMNEQNKQLYEEFCRKFETLLTSEKVWRINSSERSSQIKSSAQTSVTRYLIEVGVGVFNFLKSEFDVPFITDRTNQLFFYPKFLLIVNSPSSFTAVPYSSVSMIGKRQRFNEDNILPSDAKKLGVTWKYVNKNGGPDRRFADNKQIPVVEYGDVTIEYRGNSSRFEFSNSDALIEFVDSFHKLQTGRRETTIKVPFYDSTMPPKRSDYFENVTFAAQNLYNQIKLLNCNKCVKSMLAKYDEQFSKMDNIGIGEINPRLLFICLADVIKSYEGLGHKLDLNTEEGLGIASFVVRLIAPQYDSIYNNENIMRTKGFEIVKPFLETFHTSFTTTFPQDKFFVVEMMRVENIDDDLVSRYVILLYRFASIIAKADGIVSDEEAKWLGHIMSFATVEGASKNGNNVSSSSKGKKKEVEIDPEEELNSLIGLLPVKEEVTKLTNFIKIQLMRDQKGLKTVPISYHCVFTGNPGTGKTTVARIVAEIYKKLGILKKGHLIETDRSGLVAEYVGQTAIKTNKIIDEALDGVLFIDEAYSLVKGDSNDFGTEAITTLLKRMEDDRDRLVVILAGYSHEMQNFINSNPGLQSRFNRYINFTDYDSDELMQIFMLSIKKNQYKLTSQAEQKLGKILSNAVRNKDVNFGNGRYVRNLFEKTIEKQATRLASVGNVTNELLEIIEDVDIPE